MSTGQIPPDTEYGVKQGKAKTPKPVFAPVEQAAPQPPGTPMTTTITPPEG